MSSFLRGFIKKAKDSSPEEPWLELLRQEEKELAAKKENKRARYSPRELSEWQGPEAWYRGNP